MTRSRWLLLAIVVLAVANLGWGLYSRWGLITVHVKEAPIADVVRSIEKQGHLILRTDLPPETKVTMDVDNVTLHEAMETLSVITETRWNLAYVFAADKPAVMNAINTLTSGTRLEEWERISYPVPTVSDSDTTLPDPRKDQWNVQEVPQQTAQAYLEQGGQSVAASFYFPKAWNPAISGTLASGKVTEVVPKLAKLTGGHEEEVFLLLGGSRRGEGEEGGPPGGGGGFAGPDRRGQRPPGDNNGPRREGRRDDRGGGDRWRGMEARELAEIAKLPAAQQASARKEMEERKALFEQLRELPPEQRREKFEEMMDKNGGLQSRMDARMDSRDSRRTPAQKVERARKYVDRKQQMKDKM